MNEHLAELEKEWQKKNLKYVKSLLIYSDNELIERMKDCWRLGLYVRVEQQREIRPVHEYGHGYMFILHIFVNPEDYEESNIKTGVIDGAKIFPKSLE